MTKAMELEMNELETICGGSTDTVKNPLTDKEMNNLKKDIDGGKGNSKGFQLPAEIQKKLVEIGVDFLDKSYKEIWNYFSHETQAESSGNNIGRMAY